MNDRDKILSFISGLKTILENLNARPDKVIPHQYLEKYHAAWLIIRIHFDSLTAEISGGSHDAKLKAHGLSGDELAFKLAIFEDARKEPGFGGGLLKVFKISNVILTSMTAAGVPYADPIKEFKESIEILVDGQMEGNGIDLWTILGLTIVLIVIAFTIYIKFLKPLFGF